MVSKATSKKTATRKTKALKTKAIKKTDVVVEPDVEEREQDGVEVVRASSLPPLVLVGAKRFVHQKVNNGDVIENGVPLYEDAFEDKSVYAYLKDLEFKNSETKTYGPMFMTVDEYEEERVKEQRRAAKRNSPRRRRG